MKHNTKKKQKSLFKKLFHPIPPQVKEVGARFNISSLRKMARTKEQKDILNLIEQETIPSVRDAWIDYFLEKTKHSKIQKQ
jgi:hypothetical protein